MNKRSSIGLALVVAIVSAAGLWKWSANNSRASVAAPLSPQFKDVALSSGITFRHNNGSFGARWAPDTVGSGVAVLDYDGDGWQDIFFVNGRNWTAAEIQAYNNGAGKQHRAQYNFVLPPNKPYEKTLSALYRNNGNGTFTDVTRGSGLEIEMYGMGASAGDFDNDGRIDLFVTSYERTYLFHNRTSKTKVIIQARNSRKSRKQLSAKLRVE
jgi:hypothetical protein